MKFFSVFVIYFYVHVCTQSAYSLYTGAADPASELEASRLSVNVQNAYPRKQENSDQSSPIQKEYTIGPGLPYPNQPPQAAYGNPQRISGGYSPYGAVVKQHIESNPHLKTLYKTSIPKKSYTIVHPNGTIEHTDEIHAVTVRYPNYVMVKAADILAHINQPSNEIPTVPPQNSIFSPQPQENSPNPFEATRNSSLTENTEIQESVTKNRNVGSGNPADLNESNVKENPIQDVTKPTTNITLTESIPKEGNLSSIDEDLPKNAVAANPLPVYPTTPASNVQEEYKKPLESIAAETTETLYPTQGVGDAITTPGSNSTDTKNDVENPVVATNQTTPIRPTITVQVPAEVDEKEVLEVILPELLRQSTSQETLTGSTIEEPSQNEITPPITTIEEPITSYKANVTDKLNNTSSNIATVLEPNTVLDVSLSKDIINENVLNNSSQILTNITNTSNVEEPKTGSESQNNSTVPSVPNQSSSPIDNGGPVTWFHLTDENILEAIRSNASNVFFFFLPPQPKRFRETKTTIYANGTTVEEIIETDEDKDQDGQPKVIKNSTIVYNRS